MNLITEPYLSQNARWSRSGRLILDQCDDESVVVYQAYRPEIGHFAARHGYFGGEFSLSRMSWVKLLVDDVPLGLGHQEGPGGDARRPAAA